MTMPLLTLVDPRGPSVIGNVWTDCVLVLARILCYKDLVIATIATVFTRLIISSAWQTTTNTRNETDYS